MGVHKGKVMNICGAHHLAPQNVTFETSRRETSDMAAEGNIHNSREKNASAAHTHRWLAHYLPILSWLPSYRPSWLRFDLIAGLTVWAVVVPEAVAYAQLAGVPAQVGLFAAPFLPLGYALFGTSRQLMVGATPASAVMMAGTVAALAGSDPNKYAALMVGLTIIIGIIVLLRRNRAPAEVMVLLAAEEAQVQKAYAKAGRNEPCPCGSGRKFKHCHGR